MDQQSSDPHICEKMSVSEWLAEFGVVLRGLEEADCIPVHQLIRTGWYPFGPGRLRGQPVPERHPSEPTGDAPVEGPQAALPQTADEVLDGSRGRGHGTGYAVDDGEIKQREEVDRFAEWLVKEPQFSSVAVAPSSVFRQVSWSGSRSRVHLPSFPPAHDSVPIPDQHLLGGTEAASVLRTSILGMVGPEGVRDVGLWLFPYFEDATWKFIQVDDRQTGRVVVRLWGFNDPNHLRDEIVSLVPAHPIPTVCVYCPRTTFPSRRIPCWTPCHAFATRRMSYPPHRSTKRVWPTCRETRPTRASAVCSPCSGYWPTGRKSPR